LGTHPHLSADLLRAKRPARGSLTACFKPLGRQCQEPPAPAWAAVLDDARLSVALRRGRQPHHRVEGFDRPVAAPREAIQMTVTPSRGATVKPTILSRELVLVSWWS